MGYFEYDDDMWGHEIFKKAEQRGGSIEPLKKHVLDVLAALSRAKAGTRVTADVLLSAASNRDPFGMAVLFPAAVKAGVFVPDEHEPEVWWLADDLRRYVNVAGQFGQRSNSKKGA